MIRWYNFLFCFLCLAGPLAGQQELLLHQSPDLWHSTALNPAFFPENKRLAIGLPGLTLDAAHSGDITYNDLFRKDGERTVIDFGQAIDRLDPENKVFFDQRLETVSIGFRLPGGNWMLQAGHAIRLHGVITYPKTLPDLIWGGNAAYIGQEVQIAPAAQISNWNEWSLGAGYRFTKVTVAARAKYLSGTFAMETDDAHRQASIYTDPDIYQLTLRSDYGIRSASFISSIDTSGLGFDLNLYDLKGKPFSKNSGFALDLGVTANLTDRIKLSASVIDLGGKINWKENANYYRSNGSYTYNGVDFPGSDIITGSDSLDFSTALDTLNDIFRFNKSQQEFSTKLPVRFYLGGSFKLSERWMFGVAVYHQNARSRTTTAVGASAHFSPLRWLTLGGLYSVNERSAANLGFELALKPGPVQVYFLSDNIFNAFSPKSTAAVNLRLGLSVVL